MESVKRYEPSMSDYRPYLEENKNGEWVSFTDYQAKVKECQQLIATAESLVSKFSDASKKDLLRIGELEKERDLLKEALKEYAECGGCHCVCYRSEGGDFHETAKQALQQSESKR